MHLQRVVDDCDQSLQLVEGLAVLALVRAALTIQRLLCRNNSHWVLEFRLVSCSEPQRLHLTPRSEL